MRHEEDLIQQFIVQWVRRVYPDVLFTCSPGTSKSAREGSKKKKMGYLKSWPDLFFAKAKRGYHGLFIEIKTSTGTFTKDQRIMSERLVDEGYLSLVCRSILEAQNIIEKYLT